MRMQSNRDPQILNLIFAVRRHVALYDYRLPGYRDEVLKQQIWQQIAAECGMADANEAKSYWKKLHHNFTVFYRNELIRLVRANYDEAEIGPLPDEVLNDTTDDRLGGKTWSYYSDMRFIAPFRIKGTDPELERLIELAKPIVLRSSSAARNKTDTTCSATITTPTAPTITQVAAAADTQLQTAVLHLDVPPLSSAELAEEQGCLSSFFDAMFRATRVLPAHLQRRVKRELLQSVVRAEAEAEEM